MSYYVGEQKYYNRRSLYSRLTKSRLENEIKYYKNELETSSKKLHDLNNNKEGLERFAREEYLMKKENEDLYIIKKK